MRAGPDRRTEKARGRAGGGEGAEGGGGRG